MKKCLYCGNDLPKEREKYCSKECGQKHWYEKNYIPRELYENKCLFCGKEYETKKPSKYCSESCRGKYNRRLKKKYCINCNKEIDIGKSKFCDNDCMNEYYTNNPRYTKTCIWCGKEFKTNTNKQKLCGVDCQHQYEQDRRLKISQKQFKKKFETNHPNFIYIEGYVDYNSVITCECRKCGEVLQRSGQYGSPSNGHIEIQCDGCIKINNIRRSLVNILMKRYNGLVREQNRIIREKELEQQKIERRKRLKGYVCKECGKVFDAVNEGQKYCSDDCSRKFKNRAREVRKRWRLIDNGKVDWSISLDKLIKRDKNICHICKGKCNSNDYTIDKDNNFIVGKDYPSIDHVIPVSKGGTHTWDNVKLAHHYCNSIKSDNEVYEEELGQLTVAF